MNYLQKRQLAGRNKESLREPETTEITQRPIKNTATLTVEAARTDPRTNSKWTPKHAKRANHHAPLFKKNINPGWRGLHRRQAPQVGVEKKYGSFIAMQYREARQIKAAIKRHDKRVYAWRDD